MSEDEEEDAAFEQMLDSATYFLKAIRDALVRVTDPKKRQVLERMAHL